jgi:hypothetical protein
VKTALEELKHKKDCNSLKRGIAKNVNCKTIAINITFK